MLNKDFKGFKILFERFYFFMINFKKALKDKLNSHRKKMLDDKSKTNYKTLKLLKYYYPPGKIVFQENRYYLREYKEIQIKADHYFW
jgi:hypothetical protein